MSFPENFIWGGASSSYQIEGSRDLDEPANWDRFCQLEGKTAGGASGAVACDHINRYKEDIALMKRLGLMAYRLSFSMPRILPYGEISEKGLDFYDRLIDCLLENDINPWVTLYHWDMPLSLQMNGGFMNRGIIASFRKYADIAGKRFSDRVKYWCTVNEPINIIYSGYMNGNHAPGWQLPEYEVFTAWHNLLLCHGAMAQELRKHGTAETKIGAAITGWGYMPADETCQTSIDAARHLTFETYRFRKINMFADPAIFGEYPEDTARYFGKNMPKFQAGDMEQIKQKMDYFGTNIYFSHQCGKNGEIIEQPEDTPKSSEGWIPTAKSLYWSPKFYFERYKLPIVILENGVCCDDRISADGAVHDNFRKQVIGDNLREFRRAIQDGVETMGFFAWSPMDNFEWSQGYNVRFGLSYVDYESQKRTIKDSGYFYRDVIRSNGNIL